MSSSFVWDLKNSSGFVHGQRYTLDPASQHVPLNATQRALRPPRPIVPANYETFIGLPSYRDGNRCGFTLFTALSRASRPESLVIGVVDQTRAGDVACVDAYCQLAAAHWPTDTTCRYQDRIRVDARDADASTGPIAARVRLNALIQDEAFCLLTDAHMQFLPNWDDELVADWTRTENEMAVLSVYPRGFEWIGPNLTPPVTQTRHICYFEHPAPAIVPIYSSILLDNSSTPQLGAFVGAGFQFSKCHAQTRVPLDARLRWVFLGEEFLRSMQLWTHGYDIYSPSRQGHVVFHDENRIGHNGTFFENVDRAREDAVDLDARAMELELSMNRIRQQAHLPLMGAADETDVETYYPKDLVRSVDAYLAFVGVSNTDVTKEQSPCDQLHWVPYTDPAPIQALVPGYAMVDMQRNNETASVHVPYTNPAPIQVPVPGDETVAMQHNDTVDMQRKNDAASVCLVAVVVVVALAAVVGGCVRRCRRQAVAYTRVATEGEDDTCALKRV
ncbi:hypothetical protein SPRG_21386 [Saprolegnia parasitica CBS 223.65]|uniref:Uncharacterized protein n=1 Tax=Saprolegnia parasitica (strain CBS 223.65) TaxID=695850 RepID=A0A067BT91_SAPPC|nr:hypothetical protein SPRG_21386 [Saprolegnia parasitica CBS 223.65]KDO20050.1 hypothetical protein SPRG_21386 [Saprolegnia parasitica CBS 223.65]|eukprot:XP_012209241.1 hypothetical protein SPRG_21386 [Saprolegnia parasitica CBS 223.65]